jgi:hypothetical protein
MQYIPLSEQKRGINLESQDFPKFRKWLRLIEDEELDRLKSLIDGDGLVLFFKKDGNYFGAGEDSRVVFARLKNPDDETTDGWEEDANFVGVNLSKLAKGEPSQHVFGKDDIDDIKVVDRDEALDGLKGKTTGITVKMSTLSFFRVPKDRDDAPNFIRADEE